MSNILLGQLYALQTTVISVCWMLTAKIILCASVHLSNLYAFLDYRGSSTFVVQIIMGNEKLVVLPTLQEKGNEYVKMGKKHYSDAIDCYTRAVNQNALSDAEQSILYSNRAHVNLLLGNNRRALQDAEDAIKLNPSNVKVCFLILCIMCGVTGHSFLQVLDVLGVCDIYLYFMHRLFIEQQKQHFL